MQKTYPDGQPLYPPPSHLQYKLKLKTRTLNPSVSHLPTATPSFTTAPATNKRLNPNAHKLHQSRNPFFCDSKSTLGGRPKPTVILLSFCKIISHTGFRQALFPVSSGRNALPFRKHPDKVGNIAKPYKIANFRHGLLRMFQQFTSRIQPILRDEL